MKQRKDAALRWLWFSLAASIIAPALLFAYAAYSAYHDAFKLADERIERSWRFQQSRHCECFARSS
jgi:hypothetical protein